MRNLVSVYENKGNITIENIIEFHADFEYIHPFQDGNGRVGRLIALKECLRWNVIPFIIEDSKKGFYYRGLSNWKTERGWLIDACLDGQDSFEELLDMLDIPYNKQLLKAIIKMIVFFNTGPYHRAFLKIFLRSLLIISPVFISGFYNQPKLFFR